MNENNLSILNKKELKGDIFDFLIIPISFVTVFLLTLYIFDEHFITTALIYLVFFALATAYVVIKRKSFNLSALLPGTACLCVDAALALHANDFLIPVLMLFSALYCLSLTQSNLHSSGTYLYAFDLIQRGFLTPMANYFLPLRALFRALKTKSEKRLRLGAVLGLLLAVPVIIVLILLLIESDVAFESLTSDFVNDILSETLSFNLGPFYFIVALIFTPYIVSVLFTFKYDIDSHKGKSLRKNLSKFRIASSGFIGGFLGSVCLLYTVYLISQTAYFFSAFGGKLPNGAAITLSAYAIRGFFEMSIIAIINLCLIAFGAIFAKRKEESFTKLYKGLSLFLCLFTEVLIATALSKMFLYISEMGLTYKRLATAIFDVVLFICFIFIMIRLFKKNFPYFRYIYVLSLVVVAVFSLIGFDNIIGYYNTESYLSGKHETLDIDTMDFELSEYINVKCLNKLVDDETYGNTAKAKLSDIYVSTMEYYMDEEDFCVDQGLMKRHFKEDSQRYESYVEEFGSEYDNGNIYIKIDGDMEIISAGLSFGNGDESQGTTKADEMPFKKGETLIFDQPYIYYEDITLILYLKDGKCIDVALPQSDRNCYKLFTSESDGTIEVKPVDTFAGLYLY